MALSKQQVVGVIKMAQDSLNAALGTAILLGDELLKAQAGDGADSKIIPPIDSDWVIAGLTGAEEIAATFELRFTREKNEAARQVASDIVEAIRQRISAVQAEAAAEKQAKVAESTAQTPTAPIIEEAKS